MTGFHSVHITHIYTEALPVATISFKYAFIVFGWYLSTLSYNKMFVLLICEFIWNSKCCGGVQWTLTIILLSETSYAQIQQAYEWDEQS